MSAIRFRIIAAITFVALLVTLMGFFIFPSPTFAIPKQATDYTNDSNSGSKENPTEADQSHADDTVAFPVKAAYYDIANAPKRSTSSPDVYGGTRVNCDPYALPGYIDYDKNNFNKTHWVGYNDDCKAIHPPPILQLRDGMDFPDLKDKSVLFIGDSVDRQNAAFSCEMIGQDVKVTYQRDYKDEVTDPGKMSGGHPRYCYSPEYNMTLSTFFFFGFDTDEIWHDKKKSYLLPGGVWERMKLLEEIVESRPHHNDLELIVLNVGFWELARYDRLDGYAGITESIYLTEEQVREYVVNLEKFVLEVQKILPNSRIVFRQMHSPRAQQGSFFNDGTSDRHNRFHSNKVRQLNSAAKHVMDQMGLEFWHVGDFVRAIPENQYMFDDLHPGPIGAAMLWGNSILEYLARTPRIE